ncbi:MAG: type I-U CRISPR-associated RAMP protein Csb1/Cas7u [Bacteroidetes bacterium]|nr:type I-U CRISPR-associated RAMP protein Csb1/Cas7u [Bacteroidota bacterium]
MIEIVKFENILRGCQDDSFDNGIQIETELVPLGGSGAPVKPSVYAGGVYQQDRRWYSSEDKEPQDVVVIDNVPSQANRLENALRHHRESIGLPEFILDFSGVGRLPSHLPMKLSSFQFPHRNADAYLRDSQLNEDDFIKTDLGKDIFGATAQNCAPLIAWFPQALLYGFWQSHLGKKRSNSKHARAWVSEIIGWQPATTETRVLGLKGDALNLSIDDPVTFNPNDRTQWEIGKNKLIEDGKSDKLSEIGHGQVPFTGGDASLAAISFGHISQRATVSFAQLRRVRIDNQFNSKKNSACRALLVALGLHAHQLAFNRGFSLRSMADLCPQSTRVIWLGDDVDSEINLGNAKDTLNLVQSAKEHAVDVGLELDGWDKPPLVLEPKENLKKAIRITWPQIID